MGVFPPVSGQRKLIALGRLDEPCSVFFLTLTALQMPAVKNKTDVCYRKAEIPHYCTALDSDVKAAPHSSDCTSEINGHDFVVLWIMDISRAC